MDVGLKGNIVKLGDIWISLDETVNGQHHVSHVQRTGVLARGVLYYCKQPIGKALCEQQSDWHLLQERAGVNLTHYSAAVIAQNFSDENGKMLYGVCISAGLSTGSSSDPILDDDFTFWCSNEAEQNSWVAVLSECLQKQQDWPSKEPRAVMENMLKLVTERHTVQVDVGTGPKSTLGLVVTGVRIVSIVPGSPASLPQKNLLTQKVVRIEVGDCLINVDGKDVTGDNAPEVLRGNDEVGSLARIRLQKNRVGASEVVEVLIRRSSIARIKPLSEMVLAMAKVADPKNISNVTPAQIHQMKKLADDYIAIETAVIAEYQARLREVVDIATVEADVCSAFYNELHARFGQLLEVRTQEEQRVRDIEEQRVRDIKEQRVRDIEQQRVRDLLTARDAEIARLQRELDASQTSKEDQMRKTELEVEVTSQREELRSLREDLATFEKALKDADAARKALEEEVRRLKGVEEEVQEKLAEREKEGGRKAAQVTQLEEEVEAAKRVEAELRDELQASHARVKRVEEQEQELVGRRAQELELLANIKDLQSKVKELEEQEHARKASPHTELVGVGMVVRVETSKLYPLIKRISPEGAAGECAKMAEGDALLEVDGVECKHKTVEEMTALFLGPVGSTVVVKGRRETPSESGTPSEGRTETPSPHQPHTREQTREYTVTLVRGGAGPSPLKDALAELQEERDRSKALEAEMQREGLKKDEEMKREMDKSDAQRKALEEELAKCKDKCKVLEQKMNSELLKRDEAMKSEVQKRDSQCKGLEEELARLRAVEQKLRQELQDVEEERKNLKVLLDDHRRELESKDVLLKALEEERSKSGESVAAQQDALGTLQRKLKEEENKCKALQQEMQKEALKREEETKRKREEEVATEMHKRDAARQEMGTLEEEVQRLKWLEEELQEKLGERERESGRKAAQVKQLEEEVEAAKRVEAEMRDELQATHARLKRVEEELEALQQKMKSEKLVRDEEMRSEMQVRDSARKGLEEELARFKDKCKAVEQEKDRGTLEKDEEMKIEMQKRDSHCKGLEEELAKCKDKCKALKQKMNSEMLQRDEAMKSEVQKRDSQCKGLEEELARLRAVEQKLRQELQDKDARCKDVEDKCKALEEQMRTEIGERDGFVRGLEEELQGLRALQDELKDAVLLRRVHMILKQLLKQHDSRTHNMLDVLSSNGDGGVGEKDKDKDKEGREKDHDKEGCEKDQEGCAHLLQSNVEKYSTLQKIKRLAREYEKIAREESEVEGPQKYIKDIVRAGSLFLSSGAYKPDDPHIHSIVKGFEEEVEALTGGGGGAAARAPSHAASSPTDHTNKPSHVLPNGGRGSLHPDQPVFKQASSSAHAAAATVAVAGGARASGEREPSGEFAHPLAPPNRKAASAVGEASGSGGGDWLGNLTQPLLVAVMSAGLSSTSPTYEERLM